MASEAVIIDLGPSQGMTYQSTVASGGSINKGALMNIATPRTVYSSQATVSSAAGIAAADKSSTDSRVTLGIHTEGIFDLVSAGQVSAAQLVMISGVNVIGKIEGTPTKAEHHLAISRGLVMAKTLEDGSANARIACKLIGL